MQLGYVDRRTCKTGGIVNRVNLLGVNMTLFVFLFLFSNLNRL